jgi:hypothetical protein
MKNNVILVVEDNPDDEALTVRTLKKSNIVNELWWPETASKHWITCLANALTRAATYEKCPRQFT